MHQKYVSLNSLSRCTRTGKGFRRIDGLDVTDARQQGPVVRINPDEIHISDPDFYAVLYAGGQERRHKVFKHTRQFGAPDSVLGTVHHDLHRMRRAILSPFFSKASVYRLEPVIQDKVDEMMERMEGFRVSRQPIPLFEMFAAYTNGKAHSGAT